MLLKYFMNTKFPQASQASGSCLSTGPMGNLLAIGIGPVLISKTGNAVSLAEPIYRPIPDSTQHVAISDLLVIIYVLPCMWSSNLLWALLSLHWLGMKSCQHSGLENIYYRETGWSSWQQHGHHWLHQRLSCWQRPADYQVPSLNLNLGWCWHKLRL